MTIGERLKEIRKKQGYSAKDFAEITGIPHTTYSNYENDNREFSITNLRIISKKLGVKIDYIVNGDDDENAIPSIRDQIIIGHLNNLNDQGKDKLIIQAEILAKVPEYQRENSDD